jgi:predicted glutamine amidotransferase
MCGHVGIAGKLTLSDEKTMKRLLLFDYLRGPDSTGIAVKKHASEEVDIVKIASHPLDLFDSKKFTAALNAYSASVFLGHNRAATRGKVNTINAHPFECGHIIGAHNGTLHMDSWKELDKLLDEDTDVDSLAIFQVIEKFGIEKATEHLFGAWALVWIDLKENTLNFLRNKERTLFWGQSKDKTKLFWASEHPMIDCATELSDNVYDWWQDKKGYIYFAFEPNTMYSWDLDELREGGAKPKLTEFKERSAPPAVTQGNFTQGTTTQQTTTGGTASSDKKPVERLNLVGDNDDPFASVFNVEAFKEMAKAGCSYCGEDIDPLESGITVFYEEEIVLCPKCNAHPDTRIYLPREEFDFVVKAM